jgi:hypothetical protein
MSARACRYIDGNADRNADRADGVAKLAYSLGESQVLELLNAVIHRSP